jgi:hypothetical protein
MSVCVFTFAIGFYSRFFRFRVVKRRSLINKTCRVTKKARRTEPFGVIPFLELFSSIIGAPNDPTHCLFKIITLPPPHFLHTVLPIGTGGINARIANFLAQEAMENGHHRGR